MLTALPKYNLLPALIAGQAATPSHPDYSGAKEKLKVFCFPQNILH
jgi:hypothetical protein